MLVEWISDWKFWFGIVGGIAMVVEGLLAWQRRKDSRVGEEISSGDDSISDQLTKSSQESERKFTKVDQRLDGIVESQSRHGERLTRLERDVANLPSHQDIGRLYKRIARLEAQVAESGAVGRQNHQLLSTINAYLMQKEEKS